MALQSCYECNKKISTKALMCPQCGAPQNPVSGLVDKAKDGFLGKAFNKVKNNIKQIASNKIVERMIEENLERVVQKEIIDGHEAARLLAEKVSPPDDGFTSYYSKVQELSKFPCLHSLLTGSESLPPIRILSRLTAGIESTPLVPVENKLIDEYERSQRDTVKEFQVLMEMMEIPSGHDWGEKLIWMGLEDIRKKIEESKDGNSKWWR